MNEIYELHGVVVADVVDFIGGFGAAGVGMFTAPIRVALGRMVDDAYDSFDDVVDVGEISLHLAVVVDVDGAIFQNRFGKEKKRHVRASPGAVDGKKAQTRSG